MSEQSTIRLEQLAAELERLTEQAVELSSRVRSTLEGDARDDLLQTPRPPEASGGCEQGTDVDRRRNSDR